MPEIVDEHLLKGTHCHAPAVRRDRGGGQHRQEPGRHQFYKNRCASPLRNCGVINPENIDEYIARRLSGPWQGSSPK